MEQKPSNLKFCLEEFKSYLVAWLQATLRLLVSPLLIYLSWRVKEKELEEKRKQEEIKIILENWEPPPLKEEWIAQLTPEEIPQVERLRRGIEIKAFIAGLKDAYGVDHIVDEHLYL